MSYVLKTDLKIGDSEETLYFRGWAGKNSKHPNFADKIRFARHWKDKTNCKRFLNRNMEHLEKYQLYVDRIIKYRTCEYCGGPIEKESRTDTKFCSDYCKMKANREG